MEPVLSWINLYWHKKNLQIYQKGLIYSIWLTRPFSLQDAHRIDRNGHSCLILSFRVQNGEFLQFDVLSQSQRALRCWFWIWPWRIGGNTLHIPKVSPDTQIKKKERTDFQNHILFLQHVDTSHRCGKAFLRAQLYRRPRRAGKALFHFWPRAGVGCDGRFHDEAVL